MKRLRALGVAAAAAALLATTFTASPASAADVYVKFKSFTPGDCLDATDGSRVVSIKCNEDDGQREEGWQVWRIADRSNGHGYYSIESAKYPGKCLTGDFNTGRPVSLAYCQSSFYLQRWLITGQQIKNMDNGNKALYDGVGTINVYIGPDSSVPWSNTYWNQYDWPWHG